LSDGADCIFCKIVAGEIPSTEVASTEDSYAFRDLNPVAPVHVLVVPRTHVRDATEVGEDHGATLADMLQLAREIAASEGILDGGYRLVFNVGDDAGNSVPHLHLHVLGGRSMAWPPG
jgi:histidine triad (HIT) family protein